MVHKADVISIVDGGSLSELREPSVKLVELLEHLLEQARSGEICGVVGAVVYPPGQGYIRTASGFWAGYPDSLSSVGALEDVKYCMLGRMNS